MPTSHGRIRAAGDDQVQWTAERGIPSFSSRGRCSDDATKRVSLEPEALLRLASEKTGLCKRGLIEYHIEALGLAAAERRAALSFYGERFEIVEG